MTVARFAVPRAGSVIGWKLGHPPGLMCREAPDGAWDVLQWPDGHPVPTEAAVVAWAAEFEAALPALEAERALFSDPRWRALVRYLARHMGVSEPELRAELVSDYGAARGGPPGR